MNTTMFLLGKVEEVEDRTTPNGSDGLRVKARTTSDNTLGIVPWAFPLLPKVFQSVPKVGEYVLIFLTEIGNTGSQRYYIGPIISQPQDFELSNTKAKALSLTQENVSRPLKKITNDNYTKGSFPEPNDVAVVGRGQEDIVLKFDKDTETSEVDLRAGIRQKPVNDDDPSKFGNIIFNSIDPTYIQLKYKKNLVSGYDTKTGTPQHANSIVNVVADKINLVSNKDNDASIYIHDNEKLIEDKNLSNLMSSLHPAVKGDKLMELLEIMRESILRHVHPWAGMEQCGDWAGAINKLKDYSINEIISQDIRIS
jgi:hypothetical protein|nr:MAG TPA: hypothetical protein [Ackermannviridae sp.]DAS65303.1 MAG TPA: hypothetical protein [Ackermannviridae sp.]